jgi:hypothetical protein
LNREILKEKYLLKRRNFSLILAKIHEARRFIEIHEILRSTKEKFGSIRNELFLGWLQQSCLISLIVTYCFDISQSTEKNVSSLIRNILGEGEYIRLLITSQLPHRLKELKEVVELFRGHRNKRISHLDLSTEVKSAFCDFRDLRNPLLEIYQAIAYIDIYMCDMKLNIGKLDPLLNDLVILQFQNMMEEIMLIKNV